MTDLSKQDRSIFWFVLVSMALFSVALWLYAAFDLEKQVTEALPNIESIEGFVSEVKKRGRSYVEFKIGGKSFRSQELTDPCLNITSQIENGRMVILEYVKIKKWPRFDGNCILNAKFLTDKKARSGRSKINT